MPSSSASHCGLGLARATRSARAAGGLASAAPSRGTARLSATPPSSTPSRGTARLAALGATLCLLGPASAWSPSPHGAIVAVTAPGGLSYVVEIAVEGLTSFRVSVVNSSSAVPAQLATPMVVDKGAAYATYSVSQVGSVVNLTAPGVGSVAVDAAGGALYLSDAAGKLLTSAPRLLAASAAPPAVRRDTCANPQTNTDAANPQRSRKYPDGTKVASQADCCAACNGDASCTAWVYDTQADTPNCWPLEDAGGLAPGVPNRVTAAPPPPPALAFAFTTSAAATFSGAGTDGGSALTLLRTGTVHASVANTATWTPSFYCSDGWSALAVSPRVDAGDGVHGTGVYGVSMDFGAAPAGGVTVHVTGDRADLYLTPAADLREHVTLQAALEGRAAVLPRYAFAFWACRWGWVNQSYIEGVLQRFRALNAPLE